MTLIDVQRVECDADSRLDGGLDSGNLGSESFGVVVTTSGEFDVVAGVENGTDKAGWDGGRSHTSNHDGWLPEQAGERSVDVKLAVAEKGVTVSLSDCMEWEPMLHLQGLDELWHILLRPFSFVPGRSRREGLGTALALVSNNQHTNTSTLKVSLGKSTDTARATRSKVNGVSSRGREVGRLAPVNGRGEDLIAQGGSKGTGDLTKISTCPKGMYR